MDRSAIASNTAQDEGTHADKMRLDSFRLGRRSPPASMNNPHGPKSSHARSHSRNGSVSIPLAFPTPLNTSASVTTTDEPPTSPSRDSVGLVKRSSHHRRRSSVSTRRESADMMGVSLPTIASVASDDNINLGDKDSIRRRALQTLEGRTDVGTFSKVEIPEFDGSESAKRPFEFPSKPSYPPGTGVGLSSLIGSKRDSLGKFMTSSSTKEQLGTLMEEEEEEEETAAIFSSPVEVTVTSPSPAPARRRPASLNLRPLSLASGGVIESSNAELPTPVLTPSPNPRPGLRSLTLGAATNKRKSLILTQSPSPLSDHFARRPSLNLATSVEQQSFRNPSRRSSIPYVCSTDTPPQSMIGLPTPEMTPITSEPRRSAPNESEDMEQLLAERPSRPLSTSEQHFLFQAHATLVQRITDLERALSSQSSRSSRSWSRPVSYASDTSSVLSEPSDEMLQLIADLKAERDELKKDTDGWRVRVGDLQHQVSMLAKRVETERRDAWVARERVGLLEVEKASLDEALSKTTAEALAGQEQLAQMKTRAELASAECEKLKAEVERMRSVEEECARLKTALEEEKKKREELEHDLDHAGLLDTPRAFDVTVPQSIMTVSRSMMFAKNRGLGFQSMDSESSFTDVDSVCSPRDKHEFGLNAVAEEDEETLSNFSEEDELARFEDEEEGDEYAFPTSMSASSFGSADGDAHSSPVRGVTAPEQVPSLVHSNASTPSLPSPDELPHARHASLSKTWTFPTSSEPAVVASQPEEIDRFFGCLEDVDNSPPMHSRMRSLDSGKRLFAEALGDEEGELPPFVIPADVGVEVTSLELKDEGPKHSLDVVVEEEEEEEEEDSRPENADEEFVGEVDEGGIKFTFTLPPEYEQSFGTDVQGSSVEPKSSPINAPFDDEEDSSFTFSHSCSEQSSPPPSSIPRLVSAKATLVPVSDGISTPVKSSPVLSLRNANIPSVFTTPPSKRGGAMPTFIPQPRGLAGSPISVQRSPNVKGASFIPQPRRTLSPAPSKASVIMSPTSRPFSKPLPSLLVQSRQSLLLHLQQ